MRKENEHLVGIFGLRVKDIVRYLANLGIQRKKAGNVR